MDATRDVRLFTFPGSNAAATAELVLAHGDVPHERVQLLPGLHAASLKLRGFPAITVPAMQVDQRKISGSRAIARCVADELAPDAGLLPEDPVRRERVLAAERDGERLQNAVRRVFYATAATTPAGVRKLVAINYGFLPNGLQGLVARGLVPAAHYGHGVRVERGPGYIERVADLLRAADSYLEDGVLGDPEHPNVADFQFAPNVVALGEILGPLGEYVRGHQIWAPMQRLLPSYPVTFDIEPPREWLAGVFSTGGS